MPISLGNTTITGLAAGGLPSSVINAVNMNSSGAWAPTGTLISTCIIRNSSRTAMTPGPSGICYGGAFTKLNASSNLIVVHNTFGVQFSAGNCGLGLRLDTATWDYGSSYQYDGAWVQSYQTTQCFGTGYFTGVTAGSHNMYVGWNTKNNSAGETPFYYLNPNGSDEGRNGQTSSTITIYEVAA
jgi:hypothetical protein